MQPDDERPEHQRSDRERSDQGDPTRCNPIRRAADVYRACLWEAQARKAGNVHPQASFPDLTFADFEAAAQAIAPILGAGDDRPLGTVILEAVQAVGRVARSNVNLGVVLLLAPLARADARGGWASISRVLADTTVDDARDVYAAIRRAAPGGLGRAASQDIREEPTLTLREVMALAAERDLIGRQYARDFADVFHLGLPALLEGIDRFGRLETAIQHCQLVWLASFPDSLIVRKCGGEIASEASRRAAEVLTRGGLGTDAGRAAYADLDAWLRADGHARNPGTTADLIAACLFAALRQRSISETIPF